MSYFVYILHSQKISKYYIGYTNDLDRRLHEHNIGHEKFSRTGCPWTLVYSKKFDSKIEAHREEMRIKKRKSKNFIEELIKAI